MANAPRDNNYVPVLMGVLNTDGTTLVPIAVSSTSNGVKFDLSATISFTPSSIALRDANNVTILMGVSSADGVTPLPVSVTSSGAILVDS